MSYNLQDLAHLYAGLNGRRGRDPGRRRTGARKTKSKALPTVAWDRESVRRAIDSFIEERGRMPENGDFTPDNGLPSLSAFLRITGTGLHQYQASEEAPNGKKNDMD